MKYKDGVYTEIVKITKGERIRLLPSIEIVHAMRRIDQISQLLTKKEITITAIFDGKHMEGSKHYSGNAFDMRKWKYSPEDLTELIKSIKTELGYKYDVIVHESHIHIEYDPK